MDGMDRVEVDCRSDQNEGGPPDGAAASARLLPIAVQVAVIVSGLNGLVQIIRAAIEFGTGHSR